MNLQENIHRIKEMMGIDNTRHTFDIQKLVDDNIIFVTKPGDGQGGIAEPNWDGDCSVITLDNLTDEEIELNPWRLKAIKHPLPNCIPFVQDRQSNWDDEKYHQVISSIKRAGGDIKDYIMNLQENIDKIQSMMGVTNEGLHDTSWENDEGDKITLMDLLNATEDIPVRNISVEELKPHLLSWDGDEDEVKKIDSSDLQYPILIFVNDNGGFITIIDGHHRAQKAARQGLETIRAKVIPINSLPKHIKLVFKHMMSEGKDAYVSRASYDQEYEEEYPKWKKTIIKILESEIDSYGEINDGKIIVLLNKENLDKNLIKYDKINERLWYDYSLQENLSGYIPYGYLSRHFKYALQDFFKKHFPDYGVRELTAANLVSY